MIKVKQRPSGLNYTKTKYSGIYEKIKEYVLNHDDLPTLDEFYREFDSLARISKVKDVFGAMAALRRLILTDSNAHTKAVKKFVIVTRNGKEYVDINKGAEKDDK